MGASDRLKGEMFCLSLICGLYFEIKGKHSLRSEKRNKLSFVSMAAVTGVAGIFHDLLFFKFQINYVYGVKAVSTSNYITFVCR